MKKKLEYSNRLEIFKNSLPELSTYEIEKLVEHSMCTNLLNTYDEIVAWAEKIKNNLIPKLRKYLLKIFATGMLAQTKLHTPVVNFLRFLALELEVIL